MKTLLIALLLSSNPVAPAQPASPAKPAQSEEKAADAKAPVKRGAALTGAPAATLKSVVADPAVYAGKVVTVQGDVKQACTKKGCWIEVVDGDARVRVTFKNYGFFVPLDSAGSRVTAEGIVKTNKLSKEKADHYAGEGASLKRDADGSATEIEFVANGVELRRSAIN